MAVNETPCADCGGPTPAINPKTLAAGSKVREPGEALCPGCSSSRVLLVRIVDRLPNNLADIKAKRMVSA